MEFAVGRAQPFLSVVQSSAEQTLIVHLDETIEEFLWAKSEAKKRKFLSFEGKINFHSRGEGEEKM